MSFDPDAFLASFNPDEFLAEPAPAAPPVTAPAPVTKPAEQPTICRMARRPAPPAETAEPDADSDEDDAPARIPYACRGCNQRGHRWGARCPNWNADRLRKEERRSLIWARAEAMRRRARGEPEPPPPPAPANDVGQAPAGPPSEWVESAMADEMAALSAEELDEIGGWAGKGVAPPSVEPPPPAPEPEPPARAAPPPPERAAVRSKVIALAKLRPKKPGGPKPKRVGPAALNPAPDIDGPPLGPDDASDPDLDRPRQRRECEAVPRPCPYVRCSRNLFLDVDPASGAIKFNFPNLEPWEVEPGRSCAQDLADDGPLTLDVVGRLLNLTRERVRQIEVRGLTKLKPRVKTVDVDLDDAPPPPGDNDPG